MWLLVIIHSNVHWLLHIASIRHGINALGFRRQLIGPSGVCALPEVPKVPEPANLVRRKHLKISLLAENVDQNPLVENTETFLSHVYFILTENLWYTLFS